MRRPPSLEQRPRIATDFAQYALTGLVEFGALYSNDTRLSFGYCLPLAKPGMPELTVILAPLFERATTLGHFDHC